MSCESNKTLLYMLYADLGFSKPLAMAKDYRLLRENGGLLTLDEYKDSYTPVCIIVPSVVILKTDNTYVVDSVHKRRDK